MIIGLSIRKSAENVRISVKTSFYMRHKVHDCIRVSMVLVMWMVYAESFKVNHRKSEFEMQDLLVKEVRKLRKEE